ncbi:hypothetical protein ACWDA9_20880, partial [Streptomyces sp. NPDC001193]
MLAGGELLAATGEAVDLCPANGTRPAAEESSVSLVGFGIDSSRMRTRVTWAASFNAPGLTRHWDRLLRLLDDAKSMASRCSSSLKSLIASATRKVWMSWLYDGYWKTTADPTGWQTH